MPGRRRSVVRPSRLSRVRNAGLALVTAFVAGSCGDVTSPPDRGGPRPIIGSNVPVSATIDTAGGTIVATGTDGARYTLTIPRHALAGPVTITVTPLQSLDGLPLSGRALAASLKPDGLRFRRPVELRIVSPTVRTPRSVGLSNSGEDVSLVPAFISGDTARLRLMHFSNGGVSSGTANEVSALAAQVTSGAGEAAEQLIAAELARAGAEEDYPDPALLAAAMLAWYENGVLPGLEDADGTTIDGALAEWLHWLTLIQLLGVEALDAEVASAEIAAADALLIEIDRLNESCIVNDDPTLVPDIGRYVSFAEAAGLVRVEPALALEAVIDRLCIQVAIVEATVVGSDDDARTLEVRAGISVGGRAPTFDTPIDIDLTPSGVIASPMSGTTDAGGWFRADLDVSSDDADATVRIEAMYPDLRLVSTTRTVPVGPGTIDLVGVTGSYALVGDVWNGEDRDILAEGESSLEDGELSGERSGSVEVSGARAEGGIRHLSRSEGPTSDFILRLHTEGELTASAQASGGADMRATVGGFTTIQSLFVVERRVYYRVEGAGQNTPMNPGGAADRFGVHIRRGETLEAVADFISLPWGEQETALNSEGWLEPGAYMVVLTAGFTIELTSGTQAGHASQDATFTLYATPPPQ